MRSSTRHCGKYSPDIYHFFDLTAPSGDWAGAVWNAAGIPGQEESCAQRTGFDSCEGYVRANGAAFQEACEWIYTAHVGQPLTGFVRLGG